MRSNPGLELTLSYLEHLYLSKSEFWILYYPQRPYLTLQKRYCNGGGGQAHKQKNWKSSIYTWDQNASLLYTENVQNILIQFLLKKKCHPQERRKRGPQKSRQLPQINWPTNFPYDSMEWLGLLFRGKKFIGISAPCIYVSKLSFKLVSGWGGGDGVGGGGG